VGPIKFSPEQRSQVPCLLDAGTLDRAEHCHPPGPFFAATRLSLMITPVIL